jgi:hypothetical protein
LWVVLVELSLLLFLRVWWLSPADAKARRWGTVLLLLSTPFFLELHVGQFTFLATAVCATAMLLPRSDVRGRLSAGVLAFSGVFLKLFPLAALPAMRSRPFRAPLVGALAAVAVLGAGALVYPDASRELLRLNAFDDTARPHPGHISLLHVFRLILVAGGLPVSGETWGVVAPLVLVAGLAAIAILVWRWRLDGVPAFVLLMLGFLLLFYRAGEHHWSATLLLSALGLSTLDGARIDHHEALLGRVCLVLVAAPTTFMWLSSDASQWSTAETLLLQALKVIPGLLIFALVFRTLRPGTGASADVVTRARRPIS